MTRELDRQVAEKVFGQPVPDEWGNGETHWHSYLVEEPYGKAWTDAWDCEGECVRPYSSDPAACALVEAMLRKAGVEYAVLWYEGDYTVRLVDEDDERVPWREHVVRERAVCLFAIECAEAGLLKVKA